MCVGLPKRAGELSDMMSKKLPIFEVGVGVRSLIEVHSKVVKKWKFFQHRDPLQMPYSEISMIKLHLAYVFNMVWVLNKKSKW